NTPFRLASASVDGGASMGGGGGASGGPTTGASIVSSPLPDTDGPHAAPPQGSRPHVATRPPARAIGLVPRPRFDMARVYRALAMPSSEFPVADADICRILDADARGGTGRRAIRDPDRRRRERGAGARARQPDRRDRGAGDLEPARARLRRAAGTLR